MPVTMELRVSTICSHSEMLAGIERELGCHLPVKALRLRIIRGRERDLENGVEVARFGGRNTAAAESQLPTLAGSCGNGEVDGPGRGRRLDLAAERCLPRRHRK